MRRKMNKSIIGLPVLFILIFYMMVIPIDSISAQMQNSKKINPKEIKDNFDEWINDPKYKNLLSTNLKAVEEGMDHAKKLKYMKIQKDDKTDTLFTKALSLKNNRSLEPLFTKEILLGILAQEKSFNTRDSKDGSYYGPFQLGKSAIKEYNKINESVLHVKISENDIDETRDIKNAAKVASWYYASILQQLTFKSITIKDNVLDRNGNIIIINGKYELKSINNLDEAKKFALAMYNAGPGTINQARSLALVDGKDTTKWSDVNPYLDVLEKKGKIVNGKTVEIKNYVISVPLYESHFKNLFQSQQNISNFDMDPFGSIVVRDSEEDENVYEHLAVKDQNGNIYTAHIDMMAFMNTLGFGFVIPDRGPDLVEYNNVQLLGKLPDMVEMVSTTAGNEHLEGFKQISELTSVTLKHVGNCSEPVSITETYLQKIPLNQKHGYPTASMLIDYRSSDSLFASHDRNYFLVYNTESCPYTSPDMWEIDTSGFREANIFDKYVINPIHNMIKTAMFFSSKMM